MWKKKEEKLYVIEVNNCVFNSINWKRVDLEDVSYEITDFEPLYNSKGEWKDSLVTIRFYADKFRIDDLYEDLVRSGCKIA